MILSNEERSPLKLLAVPLGILLLIPIFLIGIFFFSLAFLMDEPKEEEGTATTVDGTYMEGQISPVGEKEIPAQFIPIYKEAAKKYKLNWILLAAEHKVETNFSSIKHMISPVGATGPLQFMPCTFVGWAHPSCKGLGKGNIPDEVMRDPKMVKKFGGYAIDGNGDGITDINNNTDAIYSAANYLAASGAAKNPRKAIFTYNHASWYVDRVMRYMSLYGSSQVKIVNATPMGGGGSGTPVKSGKASIDKAIAAGKTIVGKSPYNWGGGRTQYDIDRRSFDCSSFIRWIYDEGGVDLGPISGTTTDTILTKGRRVSIKDVKIGDLVYFDTYKKNGHISIYLGNNKIMHDSSKKGVTISDLDEPYFKKVFTGTVIRVVE